MANKKTTRPEPPATAGATQERGEPRGGAPFPIVGLGASAGGLEAFRQLLGHLPLDTGMGFVLVQHLDPEHESALTQLLARVTSLPVREVTNHQRVEANHVYVIPPNTNLGIARGVLTLQPRQRTRTPHRSIDTFFEALAEDQRERAIGVVLSGTATDGTLGLEAIKAEGGITFAQDESARYDSMPHSAVAAGCVDFVLSPENIAKELARIAKHPHVAGTASERLVPAEDDRASATAHEPRGSAPTGRPSVAEDGFKKILLLLRNRSGVDFSLYRPSTIQRRISRRMVLNRKNTLAQYAQFLRGNPKELDDLYSDTLISVTSFFRNPDAFEVLQRKVLPKLLEQRGDEPLRVWVLGCSTGQEAYSIAMAFVEAAEKAPRMRKLQVFATDLNDALLDKARHGLYPKNVAGDVTPERLRRFFVEEEGGYRVGKPLREMVVFARQNVISDPPFSRMDLISCRNLLIYLEPSLQRKVFPVFHYALKPAGFLYLGASETIGTFAELFEPVDKKHKIYSKKAAPTPAFRLPVAKERSEPSSPAQARKAGAPLRTEAGQGEAAEGFRAELDAQREADRLTAKHFAPPSVLVNAELQILQFRGPTSAYLEPPTGKASFDVLKMARGGLMLPLRAAINKAKKENRAARKEKVRIEGDGKARTVNVEVIPLKNLRERCFLILFEDADKARDAAPAHRSASGRRRPLEPPPARAGRPARGRESRRAAELETELAETRDYLQSMQEQHEAANEELQAANEEVQSANEELQSINEELETSKEELESTNEELTTVNEEMTNRNAELARLNSDLVNVQTSAHLAIVLLGRDLTIRRFSAQAERQFNLLAPDVGRPIGTLRHQLDLPDLEEFVTEAIVSVRANEREVRDRDGRWFSLRVRPYLTLDDKVDGAVLVLVDIDDLKRSEQAVAAARDYAASTVETVREPLLVLDGQLRVESANRSFYRTFRATPDETLGRSVFDLGNRQWDIPRLRTLLEEILPQSSALEDFEVEHAFEELGHRTMLLNARRILDQERKTERVLLAIEDISERKQAEEGREHLAAVVGSAGVPILSSTLDGIITSWNRAAEELYGYAAEEAVGQHLSFIVPAEREADEDDLLARIRRGERVEPLETVHQAKDGRQISVVLTPSTLQDGEGRIIGVTTVVRDLTERRKAEAALRQSEERYRSLTQAITSVVWTTDAEGRFVTPQPSWSQFTGQTWEELRDFGWSNALHPEDRDRVLELWEAARAAGTLYQSDGRLWHSASGSHRHFEARGVPVLNADGSVREWVGKCLDVEERTRAEEALRGSEARFRALAEASPALIWRLDPDGRSTYVNPRYLDYFGKAADEVLGEGWHPLIHPEDAPAYMAAVATSQRNRDRLQAVVRVKDAHGAWRWIESYALPMFGAKDDYTGHVGISLDITERKQSEEALVEADHRKSEFLALLAHELRNPLAPIRNALEILRQSAGVGSSSAWRAATPSHEPEARSRDPSQTVEPALAMMERQVGQMVRLVDDLLDVERIGRGKIELRKERVELSSVVHHAVEASRPLCESRGNQLTVTLPPKPIYLDADPTRLAQIVGNVLDNACKFTSRGRIWLTVEGGARDVVIRVRDSGIGIAADQLHRIFDMFTQVDSSLERSASGLGIGLTLVKRLAELHGGTVEAQSAGVGRGSEFVVRLPIAAEAPELPPERAPSEPTATTSRRILVVDDNRDAAESLAMLLQRSGHETQCAYDGLEAVEAAVTFRPDVILLDIGLPRLNGYEAARRIRELRKEPGLVVVALTGWGQEEDRRRSEQAGIDAHLVKPVEYEALMKLLAELGAAR